MYGWKENEKKLKLISIFYCHISYISYIIEDLCLSTPIDLYILVRFFSSKK